KALRLEGFEPPTYGSVGRTSILPPSSSDAVSRPSDCGLRRCRFPPWSIAVHDYLLTWLQFGYSSAWAPSGLWWAGRAVDITLKKSSVRPVASPSPWGARPAAPART